MLGGAATAVVAMTYTRIEHVRSPVVPAVLIRSKLCWFNFAGPLARRTFHLAGAVTGRAGPVEDKKTGLFPSSPTGWAGYASATAADWALHESHFIEKFPTRRGSHKWIGGIDYAKTGKGVGFRAWQPRGKIVISRKDLEPCLSFVKTRLLDAG